jgi:hypothetical protein
LLQQQFDALPPENWQLAGLLNVVTSQMTVTTPVGNVSGFAVGSNLPFPAPANAGCYVISTADGTYTPPGSVNPFNVAKGDWFLSSGAQWVWYDLSDSSTPYVLPPATTTTLGGVIPDGVTVLVGTDGTISAVGGGGGSGVVEVLAGDGGVYITGTAVSPRVNVTPASYTFRSYDSVESQFNGTRTSFEMRVGGAAVTLDAVSNMQVVLGGVVQIPGVSYTVTTGATTSVIFDVAPPTGTTIYAYSVVAV